MRWSDSGFDRRRFHSRWEVQIDALECPSISLTIFGWIPIVRRGVAQVCHVW
jgi:hypothetical protein